MKTNIVHTENAGVQRLPAASRPTGRFLCVMLGWDAKHAAFASVFFGRGLNLSGFLRQPNLRGLSRSLLVDMP